jgi:type IV pilus assembly protein PilV
MVAKKGQADGADAISKYLSVDYRGDTSSTPAAAECFTKASNCGATELATFNISQWEARIKSALPKGRLVICRDSAPWDSGKSEYKWECGGSATESEQVAIKIGWDPKFLQSDPSSVPEKDSAPLIVLATGI